MFLPLLSFDLSTAKTPILNITWSKYSPLEMKPYIPLFFKPTLFPIFTQQMIQMKTSIENPVINPFIIVYPYLPAASDVEGR